MNSFLCGISGGKKFLFLVFLYFMFPVSGGQSESSALLSTVHFRKNHLFLYIPIAPNFTQLEVYMNCISLVVKIEQLCE